MIKQKIENFLSEFYNSYNTCIYTFNIAATCLAAIALASTSNFPSSDPAEFILCISLTTQCYVLKLSYGLPAHSIWHHLKQRNGNV